LDLKLFSRRKRIEDTISREVAGEVLWTNNFDERVRTRLWQLFQNATGGPKGGIGHAASFAHRLLLESEGLTTLTGERHALQDLELAVITAPDAFVPDIIEAMLWSVAGTWDELARFGYEVPPASEFRDNINDVLYEYRLSYELVEAHIVPRESQELHEAIVAPAIRLLSNRTGYGAVEQSYQDAIRELSQGNARDAITDAGTALQQTLQALGCEGKTLGTLIADARKRGLLAGHDRPIGDAVVKAAEWAAADRNTLGDAHNVTDATRDDAWLIVHVVGALILRLVSGARPE